MPDIALIGIQARSTSTRLPDKCSADISGKTMLGHCLDACKKAAEYLNARPSQSGGLQTAVAILVPTGDPLAELYRHSCLVFEGSEHDVLERYYQAVSLTQSNYCVRVTSDCPLIPSFLISKMLKIAAIDANRYDYFSNVDPRVRTALDGQDVEVISSRLLRWAYEHAREPRDREHVTTFIRSNAPKWAKVGCVVGYYDLSDVKLSVDTQEELDLVREQFGRVKAKVELAERIFGRRHVHRI